MIRELIRGLGRLLRPRSRWAAAVLAVESLMAGILEAVVLVLVVSAALSATDEGNALKFNLPLLGGMALSPGYALVLAAGAGVVMIGTHLHLARLTARLSSELLNGARHRAISAYAAASWERQATDREGALQETVSTLSTESSALVVHLCNVVAAGVGLIALLLAAILVSPLVTLCVLFFGAMIVLLLRPIGRLTRVRSRVYVDSNSAFTEGISQWSSMAMELRVFGVETLEIQRLFGKNDATSAALNRSRFIGRAGTDLYKDLAILLMVGGVAILTAIPGVDLAAVGTVMLLIIRSLSYAQRTNATLQSVNELAPNFESLLARLRSLQESAEPVGTRALNVLSRIELVDVAYEYVAGRPAIEGINLEIAHGEAIGVIGPSGGGKSTLAQVMLRLRVPSHGTVSVSDIPYQEIEPASWHRLITLVPQEPKLFQGTIAENIAFRRPGVSRQQIEDAARLAHVLDDIRMLPAGFDTMLGPRGIGLSGGQKQRVTIARSLLGEPQALVLDEPTSALDVRSEQLLQETIVGLKGQVTLIIIAHRLTSLACCDRVIAMVDGKIQMIGTLEQALAEVSFTQHGR